MRRDECRRCKDRMARFFVLRSSLFSSHLGQSQVVKTVNHCLYHVNQPPKCHCWLSLSGGFVVTDQHFQYSIYPDHCNDASGGRSFDSVAVILRRRATRKRQFRRVRLKRRGDYSQSLWECRQSSRHVGRSLFASASLFSLLSSDFSLLTSDFSLSHSPLPLVRSPSSRILRIGY